MMAPSGTYAAPYKPRLSIRWIRGVAAARKHSSVTGRVAPDMKLNSPVNLGWKGR